MSASGYKYVHYAPQHNKNSPYRAYLKIDGQVVVSAYYNDPKEAARAIDIALIKSGKQPVNILKKMQ